MTKLFKIVGYSLDGPLVVPSSDPRPSSPEDTRCPAFNAASALAELQIAVTKVLPVGDDRAPGGKVISFYIRMDELRHLRALALPAGYGVPVEPACGADCVGKVFDLPRLKKLWRAGVETGRLLATYPRDDQKPENKS